MRSSPASLALQFLHRSRSALLPKMDHNDQTARKSLFVYLLRQMDCVSCARRVSGTNSDNEAETCVTRIATVNPDLRNSTDHFWLSFGTLGLRTPTISFCGVGEAGQQKGGD